MKLFKKALLATAIFGAMGAQAAKLSSDPIYLSAQGVAAGLEAEDVPLELDFVVEKLTPSASTITLTFDSAVDLDDLETALAGSSAATYSDGSYVITNTPSDGTGVINDSTVDVISFDYGTGSFTFDRLSIDADEGTISFEVNLGNPVTAQSAFRMSIAGTDATATPATTYATGVNFTGAADVTYSSVDADDNQIETGVETLAVEQSQFGFSISKGFDGKIERVKQVSFSKNGDSETVNSFDQLTFVATNNQNLQAALTVTGVVALFEGDFDNGGTTLASTALSTEFAVMDTATTPVAAGTTTLDTTSFDEIEWDLGANLAVVDGKDNVYTLDFTGGGLVIPQTGNITAKVTFSSTTPAVDVVVAEEADAGSFELDATIVNIPYFPVGFEGLSTSVHFANESSNEADVIITAIALGEDGETYSGTLPALAGKEVTKFSQGAIKTALGLADDAEVKLSVTFNIDANEGDVNAYAFSSTSSGRQSLVTSQQKGK